MVILKRVILFKAKTIQSCHSDPEQREGEESSDWILLLKEDNSTKPINWQVLFNTFGVQDDMVVTVIGDRKLYKLTVYQ